MSTIPEVFVCRFSPCVTDHSVLADTFRTTQTYDPDQFHPSSNCSSSSMLCTSFTAARSCAECGYPAVYHATCFRISRIAVSSLLYFICRPAWRRIHLLHFRKFRFLRYCTVFQIFCRLCKDPWIPLRGTTDHHTITSGFFQKCFCFLW